MRERDDDLLRVDLTVRTPRRNAPWLAVVVHERRLVSRTRVRTDRSSGSLSRRFTIEDFPGRDAVTVRALAWIIAGHERHHLRVLRERYLG